MSNPPARGYPGKVLPYDYDITSPLTASGDRVYPCQSKPQGAPVATLTPGSSLPVTISGGAPHNGGHCQFAVSYDGGQNFVVLETIVRNCFVPATSNSSYTYQVQLPGNLPGSSQAVFAWSWINAVGNREYYMNCADVAISGASSGTLQGPRLFVAQLPGTPTIPEFMAVTAYDGSDYMAKRDIIQVSPATPGAVVIAPGVSDGSAAPSSGIRPSPLTVASPTPAVASSPSPPVAASPDHLQPSPAGPPPVHAKPARASSNRNVQPSPPSSPGGNGPCTVGNMQCAGLYKIATCVPATGGGGQLVLEPVAPGTVCKEVGGNVELTPP
ncbi:hypothetical protein SeLEV6574_g08421 [Synchytrium endobioticum]|nr:hypothetical protein SeLEV6574_g08421 [Synchytrium endobioticum]